MADKVIVTFIEHSGVYNAGETAGFSPEKAQELVDTGAAVFPADAETTEAAEPETPSEGAEPAKVTKGGRAKPIDAVPVTVVTQEASDGEQGNDASEAGDGAGEATAGAGATGEAGNPSA